MGHSFLYEEDLLMGLLSGLFTGVPAMLFSVVSYVLSALAIYTIASRRGLKAPWLAWIPVVNCWLYGSLSDQYRYVVKGENKSKRKVLLILNILILLLSILIIVLAVFAVVGAVNSGIYHYRGSEILDQIMGPVIGILGLCLPLVAAVIAQAIVYYMALYDIYKSLEPGNCVLFLVLSILFNVTEPFFLFFNRNKDNGMPPRKQAPQPSYIPPQEPEWQPRQPEQDPWERENKDYL